MNYDLTDAQVRKLKGNPFENPYAILIVKQEDGNWRGFMMKGGKLVQVRQGDPMTVLGLLIAKG